MTASRRDEPASSTSGMGAIDISVSRMAGECTATMRAQLGSATGGGPAPMPVGQRAPAPAAAADRPAGQLCAGALRIQRAYDELILRGGRRGAEPARRD